MARALGLVVAICLWAPAVAHASFHALYVEQVYGGAAAAPNARYVQLKAWAQFQNNIGGHTLFFYDAAGNAAGSVMFAAAVGVSDDQMTVLIATTEAQTFFGVTPDMTMSASLLSGAGGKVCWETYDCFAWGNYSGSSTGVGTPLAAIPSGMAARRRLDVFNSPTTLEQLDDTDNSATDFVLGAPAPRNNAGQTSTVDMSPAPPDLMAPPDLSMADLTSPDLAGADLAGLDLSSPPPPVDLGTPSDLSMVVEPEEPGGCHLAPHAPLAPWGMMMLALALAWLRGSRG